MNILLLLIREVRVGEHTLAEDPDCREQGDFCLPEYQELRIDKVIQHEKWDASKFQEGNDIALVRVRKHIKLFVSMIRLVHNSRKYWVLNFIN